jgi:hypothetical protein
MRDPLIELATVPAIPVHPAVIAARAPLAAVVGDLLAIPDPALEAPWRWRPTDPDDVDVRYGLYRIHERFEAAIGAIAVGQTEASGSSIGAAVPALAAMATARWEVHGAAAPLKAADWDADPGGGEWTIRQTAGHIISGQRSYSWYNAWYLHRGVVDAEVSRPPDGTLPPEPSEEDEGAGSPWDVLARLDEVVDASIAANAGLDRAAMRISARWSGLPVTIDFRLGRYGSHIREHTVQIDKTLAMLDRQPTEVERLVRLILATYGRLEALLVGRSASELERAFADGSSAVSILAATVADAAATAASVRASATG